MKKGCLPGFSFMGKSRDKERILVIVLDKRFSPGNRPCCPPTPLDRSRALGGGRDEVGFRPLALPPFRRGYNQIRTQEIILRYRKKGSTTA